MSVALCAHRFGDGTFCKRRAKDDSRFCGHHQHVRLAANASANHDDIHPLMRLTEPKDVFNVVRETLNAVRQGRISPGQAYATGHLVRTWIQVYRMLGYDQRQSVLNSQYLAQVVEAEQELAGKLGPLPLPVRIDQEAAINQLMETQPPLKSKPVTDYPGYNELAARGAGKANGED